MPAGIGKMGVGQESYYLDKVAAGAEDYYSGEAEAEGRWIGSLAPELALHGQVEPDQLRAMLQGRNPLTGMPLGLKSAPRREPVPGFDITFSSAKSVSLTWALGGHPVSGQVMDAHRAAVEAAVSYLERSACWARRGKGGATFLHGSGFLAAAYVHRSSRAGDPQLHTHVLIANATLGPDGRWSRLYHPAIYEHAKTASYLYEAHFRHELTTRLGVEWTPVEKGLSDIRGFSREQLETFSTRRKEIVEVAGPGASAREMQIATLATRRAKEREIDEGSLRELWREKAAEVGLTRERIEGHLGHERPGHSVLTRGAVERSVTEHVSHFDRRDAIRAVAENLPHGAPGHRVEALADEFLASESVIRIADTPRGPRFTTERIWQLEQEALDSARSMHVLERAAAVDPILVRRVLDARPSLKADQRAMIGRLLADGRALEVVVGEAGTGKTYATVAAAAGWESAGNHLEVAAPTWRAANVLRAEGLDARTVASFLAEMDARVEDLRPPLRPGSVLIVDEAGMVDSRSLARLVAHARRAEAKLVLIGDPAQLGEIEAGGLFAALARRAEEIRLDEVIRHRHDLDREAARLIREGRGAEALDRYTREGRVLVAVDHETRREAIVADWWEAKARGEDALMIVRLNSERELLNERAREAMRAEGRLGGEKVEVCGRPFAIGDEVITRVNDRRAEVFNRERWTIEAVDAEDRRLRLVAVDSDRRVEVGPDYLDRLAPRDGAPALEHGYAATVYQAQGATLDSAYVMADPSMDRQEFYVAASRTRRETFFYVTPEVGLGQVEFAPAGLDERVGLEHVARAAERDGAQTAAHDAALRERLGRLSTPDLHDHIREVSSEIMAERRNEGERDRAEVRLADDLENRRRVERWVERLGPEPPFWARSDRAAHRAEVDRARQAQEVARGKVERSQAGMDRTVPVSFDLRAELAVARHVASQRVEARVTAAKIDQPDYLRRELGERPVDSTDRHLWEDGVEKIETYREVHGVRDRETALGPLPEEHWARSEHARANQELERTRRYLGRELEHERTMRERSLGMEIGR